MTCVECTHSIDSAALSCPSCNALTRASELETLAAGARAATLAHDPRAARALWAEALALLPPDTLQYKSIQARIADIGDLDEAAATVPPETDGTWRKKAAATLGPVALLALKFKTVLLLLLAKGKLLLLGLTKMSTLLSMLAWVGVYWGLFGWRFAFGSVMSIYVHEMGHVLALRRFGIPADAPMFIPGLGAFVRLKRLILSRVQDARVGLAGPIYGTGAAIAALGLCYATGFKAFGAIAHLGVVMNLFNLIPVWQLDGSRGIQSLTQVQRVVVLCAAVAIWFATSEPMLLLIALAAAFRLVQKDAASEPDRTGLVQFIALLVVLSMAGVLAQNSVSGLAGILRR